MCRLDVDVTKGIVVRAKLKPAQPHYDAATKSEGLAASAIARHQRQSDLLDEALLETFPASDPVSIVHLK